MNIGIIGCGYVGGAVKSFFVEEGCEVRVYDTDPERSSHSLEDVAGDSEAIFVCVPTPTDKSGVQDLTAFRVVMDYLDGFNTAEDISPIVVKSTVLPGSFKGYTHLPVLYAPEFLTERTAGEDFINPRRIVVGTGDEDLQIWADNFFERFWPTVLQVHTTLDGAALVKYASNTFFAVKVGFFNDIEELCTHHGADFDTVRLGVILSGWVNEMHTLVPGPDGKPGYGGHCLPKDSEALVTYARTLGLDLNILRGAQEANALRRGPL
jgi:nucleotide sugar dehydrogenase